MDLQFRRIPKQRGWTLPCALCGALIRDGEHDIEVEQPEDAGSGHRTIRVWHRACFDEYLEMGEEVT